MPISILMIDDEPRVLRAFARNLRLGGYTVFTADSGAEGVALYHQELPEIVITDLRMPEMTGQDVLQAIRAHDPEANVILTSGHGDQEAILEAMRAGASDFLPKPVDQVRLESALRRAAERVHLKRELRASQAALRNEGLVPVSLTDEEKTLTTAHAKHVARTFALSYERLDPDDATDAVGLALLARSAYFAPGEAIPRALLLATLDLPDDDFAAERRAEDALARLVALGLLEAEADGSLTLHRLLAAFVRLMVEDDAAQAAVEETFLLEADRLNQAGVPGPLLAWQLHLRAVANAAQSREDERAGDLCNTLGYHLHMIGDYAGARPYYERALAINEAALGPEHPDTARSLNNLGALLQAMGDLAGARRYYERALAINEAALGPEHPDTATNLNNLGMLVQYMGDLAGARAYLERALAINEAVLGPEHPDTAHSLNNLGLLLQTMGNLGGARPYMERALAINEAALGPEHPETARSLNNLGMLYAYEGNLEETGHLMRRAQEIYEAQLGLEHPDTQRSRRSLANIEARLLYGKLTSPFKWVVRKIKKIIR